MYEGSLADRLDAILRSCNRNQTVGIPIGPDTSRIVAEIISAQIDQEFSAKTSNFSASNADRLQDDWFIGIESLERAEGVLSAVIGSYKEYGLDINGSKTAIERASAPLDNTWVSEIGAFLSHRSGTVRGARLRELLALTLKLQLEHPKEAIVSYTLSVIESRPASVRDVSALESFLMRAALIAPLAMNRICQVMINLNFDTKRVSLDRVGERFATLAERAIINGNVYEAIWLVYTMRGINVPLKSKVFSEIIETTQSSALALILLDMKHRGLFPRKLPVQKWEMDFTLNRVQTDWSWLLSYEGIKHGWLADPHKLMNKPFFQAMRSRDVVFYDPKRNVKRTIKVVQLRRRQQQKNKLFTFRMINEIRGFEFDDDYG